jgi:hypothetical protein
MPSNTVRARPTSEGRVPAGYDDTAVYDGLLDEPDDDDAQDKYLLIGFDRKANPLEVLYNFISDHHVNVFHAMPCRNIYHHLLKPED